MHRLSDVALLEADEAEGLSAEGCSATPFIGGLGICPPPPLAPALSAIIISVSLRCTVLLN